MIHEDDLPLPPGPHYGLFDLRTDAMGTAASAGRERLGLARSWNDLRVPTEQRVHHVVERILDIHDPDVREEVDPYTLDFHPSLENYLESIRRLELPEHRERR